MKYVYSFGKNTEGNKDMKELLGGKGANLAEMCSIGIPVPPGFTITTEACERYNKEGILSEDIIKEIEEHLKVLEDESGRKFGDRSNPLLISVRSGAAISMPGMMDTILNLGINEDIVEGIIKRSGNARLAWDSYRRFL